MGMVRVKTTNVGAVTLSTGVDNVTVVSNSGAASINNDTLYLDFPVAAAENFTLNNQTVKGASISGADVTFDNGIANISITGAETFTLNGAEVSAVSITGAEVNFDNNTALVSIGGGTSGGSGDGLQNISVDGRMAEVDTQTKVANINLPYASEENLDDTTTTIATAGFVNAIIRRLVGNAPSALDTLGELAAALNNDDDFAATVTNLISNKQDKLGVTNFAANLLKCNSAADLKSYWAGVRDLDFDEAGKTWTAYGSPYMANNNPKFTGSKCLVCNGSSYIQRSMTLGNTDFTAEYFWRHSASSNSDAAVSFFMDADNRFRLLFSTSNGGLQGFAKCNATAVTTDIVTASVTSSWWYCAIQYDKTNSTLTFSVRDSNDIEIFNKAYQVSFVTGSYQVVIGGNRTSTSAVNGLTGYVDEVRFSNVLRDVSSVPTEPFTLDANTISLLHFNG